MDVFTYKRIVPKALNRWRVFVQRAKMERYAVERYYNRLAKVRAAKRAALCCFLTGSWQRCMTRWNEHAQHRRRVRFREVGSGAWRSLRARLNGAPLSQMHMSKQIREEQLVAAAQRRRGDKKVGARPRTSSVRDCFRACAVDGMCLDANGASCAGVPPLAPRFAQ